MYSMKEVCEKVGMTYETLKYYCIEGLIPNVKRDKNNYRVFDENNVNWIRSLSCLKKCGMSINNILLIVCKVNLLFQIEKKCLKNKGTFCSKKLMN